MIHRVVLSNGSVLLIEEDDDCLHIASGTDDSDEVDVFICEINPSGVLVMPNSGDGPDYLTRGLTAVRAPSSVLKARAGIFRQLG